MSETLVRKFEKKGCDDDHQIKLISKIHTRPPQYRYRCVDCGNEVVHGRIRI